MVKQHIQKAYSQFLSAKSLKPRYGQKLMIAEIARTLGSLPETSGGEGSHICVIEAGTGTGKTVAYLLATLPIAKVLNKRVVLATATIALQEQIVVKDLPDVMQHSGLDFDFCLAKGRGRYLCLAKLDRILSSDDSSQLIPLYEDEAGFIEEKDAVLYKDMMGELSQGKWDGDRDNWQEEIDSTAWQRVTTDHRQCTGRRCSHIRNCAFFKSRDALSESDCIVANHDLVLADLALGGGAILPAPKDTIYIFDEGHHLPDKALNHFASNTRYRATIRWLGQSEGQWQSLIKPLEKASYFFELAQSLEPALSSVRKTAEDNLYVLHDIVAEVDKTQNTPRRRFENGVAPQSLELLARQLRDGFTVLSGKLEKLYEELTILIDEEHPSVPKVDLENVYPVIGSWLARAEACRALWEQYADTQVDESWPYARWISLLEFNDVTDYEVVASPILASRALAKDLWSQCFGAVVTSATLTALNSFDRFKYRSGTYDDSVYSAVPSPFDYPGNATLCVPKQAVEANNAAAHTESVVKLLPSIIQGVQGALVLFSSRRQMHEVFDELPKTFRDKTFVQGVESKQNLIKQHKVRIDSGRGSVIFGLASFAEGVDLPGDYCSHVVIAKIPFAVPDDPLEAALCEWIEARGGNAFMQVSVPDASVRLIQACGRLLRTESDTGRISILDKRLITKRYGKPLLEALPPFAREL